MQLKPPRPRLAQALGSSVHLFTPPLHRVTAVTSTAVSRLSARLSQYHDRQAVEMTPGRSGGQSKHDLLSFTQSYSRPSPESPVLATTPTGQIHPGRHQLVIPAGCGLPTASALQGGNFTKSDSRPKQATAVLFVS